MSVVSVCSARPNFVKLAAVHHAIQAHWPELRHTIVHTGQHYDPLFSDVFFEQLGIPQPNVNLGIHGGTREEVIAHTAQAFAEVLRQDAPALVLVYGDVNGAVGAARAAVEAGIPVAHVEAGLRSFDDSMPEEHNRKEIDALATLLLCSEQSGMDHLQEEKAKGQAVLVGNTMIDTLIRMRPFIDEQPLSVDHERYAVVTLHRPGNVDDPATLNLLMDFLGEVSRECPLVLPMHHRLRHALGEQGRLDQIPEHIRVVEPLPYLGFLRLVSQADFILTDSGGVQEEAVLLGKRCFTLRPNTERPSTIESGSNQLIDCSDAQDREMVLAFAQHAHDPIVHVPVVWDEHTGDRIVQVLREFLGCL